MKGFFRRPRAGQVRPDHPLVAVLLMTLACFCFASMDSVVRHIGAWLPAALILGIRFAFQTTVMTLWIGLGQGLSYHTRRPGLQCLRGLCLLGASGMAFYCLRSMPVAEFTAITLLAPMVVTLLASWLLREQVPLWRWACVVGAFVGALIVIRPGSGLFGWAVWFGLASTAFNVALQLITAKLASSEDSLTTHFWTGASSAAVLLVVLLLGPLHLSDALAAVTLTQWAWMLLLGVLSSTGHLLLIMAYSQTLASTLMPFSYMQLASAALVGWLAFGELPDGWGWLGMAVIALCGAASAWMNVRAAAAAAALEAQPALARSPSA